MLRDRAFDVEVVGVCKRSRIMIGGANVQQNEFNTVFCRQGVDVLSLDPLRNWIWQHSSLFGSKGKEMDSSLAAQSPMIRLPFRGPGAPILP